MAQHEEADTVSAVDVDSELADWGAEYVTALKALAASAGVPPLELHRRIGNRIAATEATPQCLTLAECDALQTGVLSEPRLAHVAACSFCSEIVNLMAYDPRHQGTFVARALASQNNREEASKQGFFSGLATGVGLGAGLVTLAKYFKSNAPTHK